MRNHMVTFIAAFIAFLYFFIAGGWLRPKEFLPSLRLKLLELGHKFKKVRLATGVQLLKVFAIGVALVTADLQAVHLRPDPHGTILVEKYRPGAFIEGKWVEDLEAPALTEPVLVPHRVVKDYGTVSRRVVTDAGVAALANAFLNTFEPENFNFHASGTGGTAEAASQTALVTEVETRVSGTQSSPAGGQYRTIATVSYTATRTITEHGIFSASTVGTMLDRSLFTGIAVSSGDSIQFTYTFTITSGG